MHPAGYTSPADLTDYQRMMYIGQAPITEACKTCRKGRGLDCRSKSGYVVPFHVPRIAAVEHLTDDEKIAAFAALQAERDRARRKTEQQLARPLTAEQQRTRAAISALVNLAYTEADARLDAERAAAQAAADAFNAKYPVGTPARYWRGARVGAPSGTGRITHPASVLGGYSAVAWVGGCTGAVGVGFVEPLTRDDEVRETAAAMVVAP